MCSITVDYVRENLVCLIDVYFYIHTVGRKGHFWRGCSFVCWRGIYFMDGNLITLVLVIHLIECLQFKCTGDPHIFHWKWKLANNFVTGLCCKRFVLCHAKEVGVCAVGSWNKQIACSEIWSSHGSNCEDYCLPGCDTVWSGKRVGMFCRILPWWWTYYVRDCAGWNFGISWFVLGPLNL